MTNQSGIGRGLITPEDLDAIHGALRNGVSAAGGRVDRIEICPHLPDDACACRKPRAGLLEPAAKSLGHSPATSVLIGDRASDLAAAAHFGCAALLVRTGHGRATEATVSEQTEVTVVDDLAAAAEALLARN